jgi:hypothetical protein
VIQYAIIGALALAVIAIAGVAIWLGNRSAAAAGKAEVSADDAKAESDALRRVDQVDAQGQTNTQTLDDLKRGDF